MSDAAQNPSLRKRRQSSAADPHPHGIGFKRPPVAHQFKKGVSGNPQGRPKGARSKRPALYEERLKSIILGEAYRTINVTEGGKCLTLSMAQAVVRALAVNGARGQLRSAQAFVALLSETERANKASYEQALDAALSYKAEWARELERRRQLGETGPEPLPHPEDVVIDARTGAVAIRGPMAQEDRVNWDRTIALRMDETADCDHATEGAIASDATHAMIFSKRLRAAKFGVKECGDKSTANANTNDRVAYTRQLDISTLTNEQLDALEEALRATLCRLEGTDEMIERKSEE